MSSPQTHILLPGLEATDVFLVLEATEDQSDTECPLTMEPIHSQNDAQFFTECVKNTDKNSRKDPDDAWTKLTQDDFSGLPSMGGIQIVKCGHKFGGAAFMYEIMTKKFKCPICRGGSVNEVTLDTAQTPSNVHSRTWNVLCRLAARVRENDLSQRMLEESQNPSNSLQVVSIFEIYHTLPWQIDFSIYRSEHPSYNERPYMVIPIPMRVDSETNSNSHGTTHTDETTIRSGE